MTAPTEHATPMPLAEALECPRCHHEVVVGIDGGFVCSSYAAAWCGRELVEGRDDRQLATLEKAVEIEAVRRVGY